MTDTLEDGLRELYAADAADFDTAEAVARLRACDYGVRANRAARGYSPARRIGGRNRFARGQRRLWAAAGASGTVVAGGVVAAVLLLSSGAGIAYAGWTSVPTRPTSAAVRAAAKTCQHSFTGTNSAEFAHAFAQPPVLTEGRGVYTGVITVDDDKLFACLTGGRESDHNVPFTVSVRNFGKVALGPGPDQLSPPYAAQGGVGSRRPSLQQIRQAQRHPPHGHWSHPLAAVRRLAGGGYGPTALGQVGSDVSAVTFSFANGDTVTATVENGWYLAWWPWMSRPTSVVVTTSTGTFTSPVTAPSSMRLDLAPACKPGTSGCVFANTLPTTAGRTTPARTGTATATTTSTP